MAAKDVTRQAYEKMLKQELSDAEYEDARGDLTGFFAVLMEIDRDLKLSSISHD